MEQIWVLVGVLQKIAALVSALYLLWIVISCLLFFLGVIAKSFEPEPWEK